jgi:hypothetical protein
MAKKPKPPAKRPPAAGPKPAPSSKGGPPTEQSEAVGKFDKFSTFALALPSFLLAVITLVLAIGYTHTNFDIGLFGIPGKTVEDYNTGVDSVQTLGNPIEVIGFEHHNYIGRSADGEVDVAVLNVGRNHNVRLGDVFTLSRPQEGVRLEFVVYDLGDSRSRAYILLGQNPGSDGERRYSLERSKMIELCGGERGITVQRQWRDQIIRRGVEAREMQ